MSTHHPLSSHRHTSTQHHDLIDISTQASTHRLNPPSTSHRHHDNITIRQTSTYHHPHTDINTPSATLHHYNTDTHNHQHTNVNTSTLARSYLAHFCIISSTSWVYPAYIVVFAKLNMWGFREKTSFLFSVYNWRATLLDQAASELRTSTAKARSVMFGTFPGSRKSPHVATSTLQPSEIPQKASQKS